MLAPSLAVLVLGNSYVFQNDLDRQLDTLLEAGGAVVETRRLAQGGYRFADHLAQVETAGTPWAEALATDGVTWHWVVLQEQSQIPGFPQTEAEWVTSRDAAVGLDDRAEGRGAGTVFMLTWGRREGDVSNPTLYPDFSTMQARLTDGYRAYASATSTEARPTWIAPVGPAFQHVHDGILADGGDPLDGAGRFARLYVEDGSHPSLHGTYLAACVIFATLTGQTPVGLPAPEDLATDAPWLQAAAAAVVFDPALGFTYPWQGADTGQPADTAPGETGPADTAPEGAEPDDGPTSCGCGGGVAGGLSSLLLALLPLMARRRRPAATG